MQGRSFLYLGPAICSCHLVAICAVCFAGISFTETPRLPLIHADLSFCESWIRSILALITFFFISPPMGVNGKTHKGVCALFRYTLLYVCIWKRGLDFVVSSGPRSRCFLYIQQKVKERLFATREMWKATLHIFIAFWREFLSGKSSFLPMA